MTSHSLMLYASLEASEPGRGAAAFAVGAAAALGAHLHIVAPHVDVLQPDSWETRTTKQIDAANRQRQQRVSALVDTIVTAAAADGVSVSSQTEWAHPFGLIPFVGDQAKLHDLVVMGTDHSVFLSERKVAEHVLFESGRPVIIVPAGYAGAFTCKRVSVAWDHTRTAARALHDASPFLQLADEVLLTAVGGERQFQCDPDRSTIETALSRKGLAAHFKQVDLGERTIGQALQEEAQAGGADLLVMGGFGHSRLRDFILGGATREVLDSPRLPVLMSH